MVAVGKQTTRRRGATTEPSNGTVQFNRRSATRRHDTPPPWTEVHGYHHGLAPRGICLARSLRERTERGL